MKKLLLFALSMGLGAMSFAQLTISVDSYIIPTGNIELNKPSAIKVLLTNNDASTVPAGSILYFKLTLDDVEFQPGTFELLQNDFVATDTLSIFLSQTWTPSTSLGMHNLCVDLETAIINAAFATNADQNRKLCSDFDFIWPLGINDVAISEISNIKVIDEVMTISVKNNSNQARIQLMSVTGQVVKTVNTSAAGQNFTQEINISDLTSGVYIVTIQNENGASVAQKVFIQ